MQKECVNEKKYFPKSASAALMCAHILLHFVNINQVYKTQKSEMNKNKHNKADSGPSQQKQTYMGRCGGSGSFQR